MKNTFALIILAASLCVAGAQTSNLLSLVNLGSGPNTGTGDPLRTALGKINTNLLVLASVADTNANVVVLSSNGVVGWVNAQNFVTSITTNIARTSTRYTLYSSNAFTFTGSNYIGQVSQLYDYTLVKPHISGGATDPGYDLDESLWASYTGTNGWFAVTNTPIFTNLFLSVVGTNVTGVGSLTIYGLDHPELYGLTVSYDGQNLLKNGSPVASLDDLSKLIHVLSPPVQLAGGWVLTASSTTNDVVIFQSHGADIFTLTSSDSGINQASGGKSGTNMLVLTPATNLVAGWFMQVATNINPPILWLTTTNYTITTNTGVATFACPINFSLSAQFFRLRYGSQITGTFTIPVTAAGGTLYPSNSWNLAAITNGMSNGGFWTGPSNGQAFVSVWMSNGVPWIKQIAP